MLDGQGMWQAWVDNKCLVGKPAKTAWKTYG
jgi:hypothetical protein